MFHLHTIQTAPVSFVKLLKTSYSAAIISSEPNALSGYKQKLVCISSYTTLAAVIQVSEKGMKNSYVNKLVTFG
jgi:hypothetical protein